jgi:hypothetical protein
MNTESSTEAQPQPSANNWSVPTEVPATGSGKTVIKVVGAVMAVGLLFVGFMIVSVSRQSNEINKSFTNLGGTLPP